MTAEAYEHTRKQNPAGNIEVNPLLVFLLILIAPYVLFFGLLILLTGEMNVVLLYQAVMADNWTSIMKTWIIGSFVLAIVGTIYFSGYRTKLYFTRQSTRPQDRRAPKDMYYVIEEASQEEMERSETSDERYAPLDDVIKEKEQ